MKKILVTGASGFLGTTLVNTMVKQGYDIIAFDISPMSPALEGVKDKITYVQGDQSSESVLWRVIGTYRPEGIIHLGAMLGGFCEANPLKAIDTNVRSLVVFFEACRVFDVKRFFFPSTIAIFAPGSPDPCPEDARIFPNGVYGCCKAMGEFLASWYGDTYGLDIRGVRPPNIWGPRRTRGMTSYTSLWLDAVSKNQPVFVENPEEKQSWLYVDDMVDAILTFWNTEHLTQRFYNLDGQVFTPREFMEAARKVVPDAKISYAEKATSKNPYKSAFSYDDTAFKRDTGWAPKFTLEAAVRAHLQVLKNMNG